MKPIDVKDNTYINTDEKVNEKDPKFKVGDHVRISKYKSVFAKGYTPNWSEEVFVIKEVKNTVPGSHVINDLKGEEIIGTFYEKKPSKYIKMSQYFPKPYEPFGGDINVKVDLSNYATKTNLKNISHIDVSSYALKSNLASLTSEVDKLDIDTFWLKKQIMIQKYLILKRKLLIMITTNILLLQNLILWQQMFLM